MSSGEASIGERMEHSQLGKPALRQVEHPGPVDSVFLAPAANSMPPADQHPVPEQGQASVVSRYRVVVEVPLHDRPEPLAGLGNGIVHALAELRFYLPQLGPHAFANRRAPHHKSPQTILPANVRAAYKVEPLGFPFPSTSPLLFSKSPQLDPPPLILV